MKSGPKVSSLSVLSLVAVMLLATSCAYFKDLIGVGPQRPVVKVQQIEVAGASLSAINLIVTLQVDNPNRFAMNLSQLKYSVTALDLVVAQGAYAERVSIPGESRAAVRLPVTINSQNAMSLAKAMFQTTKELTALIKATAMFDTPIGEMKVDFEDRKPLTRFKGIGI